MSDTQLHDELIEQSKEEHSPAEAREWSLHNAKWNKLRAAASRLSLHEKGDTKQDLRRKLAEAGVFHGGVGDENLYQYTGESVKTIVTPE